MPQTKGETMKCSCKEIIERKMSELATCYLADGIAQFLREELEKILEEINDTNSEEEVKE